VINWPSTTQEWLQRKHCFL